MHQILEIKCHQKYNSFLFYLQPDAFFIHNIQCRATHSNFTGFGFLTVLGISFAGQSIYISLQIQR